MLDLAGIPYYAKDRRDTDPVILGGGPYSYHPEAIAPFFDAFFLGDAEVAILEIVDAARKQKQEGYSRRKLIDKLRKVEGVYIPEDYKPCYGDNGRFSGFEKSEETPEEITRRLLPNLSGAPYPKAPVVPNTKTVHNRLAVEVMRGCVSDESLYE